MKRLIFLKLGGSLITDKSVPHKAEIETIARLAAELRDALQSDTDLHLLLGHGSGSFGHIPGRQYRTREGVHTPEEWKGFAQVWSEARALDQIVMEQFIAAGIPALAFPPSASVIASNGNISQWEIEPIRRALEAHLVPVIQGDVVFDKARGGTILSTEELFIYLAGRLKPNRVLIAGTEPGVWADFPACTRLITEITPVTYPEIAQQIFPSSATDVTGGMASKVVAMVSLVASHPHQQVLIFSPTAKGMLAAALTGNTAGTLIHSQE